MSWKQTSKQTRKQLLRDERGQLAPLYACAILLFLAFFAITFDFAFLSWNVFTMERVAYDAAQAGAQFLNEGAYLASSEVSLDQGRARDAATHILRTESSQRPGMTYAILTTSRYVDVTVRQTYNPIFARVLGFGAMEITRTARCAIVKVR